ncbi:hypothetical protein GGS23DRAFT_620394 [Durotheca rogersii]|uniref:uncharacterized protein n=1 Tax=Durotheca rogersii TaxID=419775 RepID=UPI00221E9B8A|nr:uncharacterized protein GGS23DRAFT_620394 [Durotheca rogersii]KAI5863624.1 hypothetical protein GGS23DRAFT_620394 [Durotheca rogersii]
MLPQNSNSIALTVTADPMTDTPPTAAAAAAPPPPQTLSFRTRIRQRAGGGTALAPIPDLEDLPSPPASAGACAGASGAATSYFGRGSWMSPPGTPQAQARGRAALLLRGPAADLPADGPRGQARAPWASGDAFVPRAGPCQYVPRGEAAPAPRRRSGIAILERWQARQSNNNAAAAGGPRPRSLLRRFTEGAGWRREGAGPAGRPRPVKASTMPVEPAAPPAEPCAAAD